MAYHPTVEKIKSYFPSELKGIFLSHWYGNIIDFGLNGFRLRKIPVCVNIPAMLSPSEREFLFRLGRENNPNNGAVVEIGVYAGGSSYFLGKGSQISGSMVFGIDPFETEINMQKTTCDGSDYLQKRKPSKSDAERTLNLKGLENVVLIEGFSTDVLANWEHGSISTLFIDGNHTQTMEDFNAAFLNFANSVAIAFHDTNSQMHPNVDKSVEEITEKYKPMKVESVDHLTALWLRL